MRVTKNRKTIEAIEALEECPAVIGHVQMARVLHIGTNGARAMLEKSLPPFAIEITLPGESTRTFRIITERLIAYLEGNLDMEDNSNFTM